MTLYSLTPQDGTVESALVTLNGVILSLDSNGKLPLLSGQSVKSIQLPAISINFVIIPFETGSISACV
jgi:hypothetical protein